VIKRVQCDLRNQNVSIMFLLCSYSCINSLGRTATAAALLGSNLAESRAL
jgi:hypothetical protein